MIENKTTQILPKARVGHEMHKVIELEWYNGPGEEN
jgi:hypothetical protein